MFSIGYFYVPGQPANNGGGGGGGGGDGGSTGGNDPGPYATVDYVTNQIIVLNAVWNDRLNQSEALANQALSVATDVANVQLPPVSITAAYALSEAQSALALANGVTDLNLRLSQVESGVRYSGPARIQEMENVVFGPGGPVLGGD